MAFLRMLAGIIVLYTVIIGFGQFDFGGPVRVLLLGALVWNVSRLRAGEREQRIALAFAAVAVVVSVLAAVFARTRPADAVVGATSATLIAVIVWLIVGTLWMDVRRGVGVNVATVLAVLCVYLLFALFFADVHQFFAALSHDYLSGTTDPPTPSDLLYFSVITLSTVGFGDVTPASQVARAVTVVEALLGQLYLVSVVAGVVGGWRRL
jgi:hypothetical protein